MTLTRERVEATPRKGFTRRQKAQVHALQAGICACGCGLPLPAVFDVDHRIPLANGGAHHPSNWQGLVPAHHRAKTREDVRAIAKCKRLVRKADPATRKPPQMRSAPFQTRLTKRVNGTVIPRNPRPGQSPANNGARHG